MSHRFDNALAEEQLYGDGSQHNNADTDAPTPDITSEHVMDDDDTDDQLEREREQERIAGFARVISACNSETSSTGPDRHNRRHRAVVVSPYSLQRPPSATSPVQVEGVPTTVVIQPRPRPSPIEIPTRSPIQLTDDEDEDGYAVESPAYSPTVSPVQHVPGELTDHDQQSTTTSLTPAAQDMTVSTTTSLASTQPSMSMSESIASTDSTVAAIDGPLTRVDVLTTTTTVHKYDEKDNYDQQSSGYRYDSDANIAYEPMVPGKHWWYEIGVRISQSMQVIHSKPVLLYKSTPHYGGTMLITDEEFPECDRHKYPPSDYKVVIPRGTQHLQFLFQVFNWGVLYEDEPTTVRGHLYIYDRSDIDEEQVRWRQRFLRSISVQCPWKCINRIVYEHDKTYDKTERLVLPSIRHTAEGAYMFSYSPFHIGVPCSTNGTSLSFSFGGNLPSTTRSIPCTDTFLRLRLLYAIAHLDTLMVNLNIQQITIRNYYPYSSIYPVIDSNLHLFHTLSQGRLNKLVIVDYSRFATPTVIKEFTRVVVPVDAPPATVAHGMPIANA